MDFQTLRSPVVLGGHYKASKKPVHYFVIAYLLIMFFIEIIAVKIS